MELHPGVTLPSVSLGDEKVEDRGKDGKHDRIVTNVTLPTLTVYLPAAEKNTGASVVICPGGGYHALAIDKEGYDGYGLWHLAIDTEASEDTKSRYGFPYGDFSKVNRAALIHAKQRAAQNDHHDVEAAAGKLLDQVDERRT